MNENQRNWRMTREEKLNRAKTLLDSEIDKYSTEKDNAYSLLKEELLKKGTIDQYRFDILLAVDKKIEILTSLQTDLEGEDL